MKKNLISDMLHSLCGSPSENWRMVTKRPRTVVIKTTHIREHLFIRNSLGFAVLYYNYSCMKMMRKCFHICQIVGT